MECRITGVRGHVRCPTIPRWGVGLQGNPVLWAAGGPACGFGAGPPAERFREKSRGDPSTLSHIYMPLGLGVYNFFQIQGAQGAPC